MKSLRNFGGFLFDEFSSLVGGNFSLKKNQQCLQAETLLRKIVVVMQNLMRTDKTVEIMNKLKVVQVDITDPHEGTVTFETNVGKRFSVMFWGQKFDLNQYYLITFSSLEYPLEWEVIFSENKDQLKTIKADNGYCTYVAYGQILSINPVTVDFGDLVMEIGEWTNDERVVGEFIYWKINRLDILEVKNC